MAVSTSVKPIPTSPKTILRKKLAESRVYELRSSPKKLGLYLLPRPTRLRESPQFFMHEFHKYYDSLSPRRSSMSPPSSPRSPRSRRSSLSPSSPLRSRPSTPTPTTPTDPSLSRRSLKTVTNVTSAYTPRLPANSRGIFRYPAIIRDSSRPANLEICFSFDTTGSMYPYIHEVKTKVSTIVRTLLNDIPDMRISIIAHGDYCDEHNYIIKRLDLSNDPAAIVEFVEGIGSTGGGDGDECYELVLRETQSLSWTPTSAKAVVIIGDAAPHQPQQYWRLDWQQELQRLINLNIKAHGVHCAQYTDFYQEIATRSGGRLFRLSNFNDVIDMFMGLCYREAAEFFMEASDRPEINPAAGNILDVPRATTLSADEKEQHLAVHRALHRHEESIILNGVTYRFSLGGAGVRFIKIGDLTYIEQNKEESSRYAHLAQEGKAITWILCRGEWGLIMEGDYVANAVPEISPASLIA